MLINLIKEPLRPIELNRIDRAALKHQLQLAQSCVLQKLSHNLHAFGDKFPAETCEKGRYKLTENEEWTTSFWTGQLWLAWELSGREEFRLAAEKQVRSFGHRITHRIDTDTHDLGFLYTLSCVSAWRLTGNRDARCFALHAAEALLERYSSTAQIIQAWGDLNDPDQHGRMIIDCNMNLPLLYWASEQTGILVLQQPRRPMRIKRRNILFGQTLRPITHTIWIPSAGSLVMAIPIKAMRMTLVGREGRHGIYGFC